MGCSLRLIDAMEEDDRITRDFTRALTGDRGELMRRMRIQFLEMQPLLHKVEMVNVFSSPTRSRRRSSCCRSWSGNSTQVPNLRSTRSCQPRYDHHPRRDRTRDEGKGDGALRCRRAGTGTRACQKHSLRVASGQRRARNSPSTAKAISGRATAASAPRGLECDAAVSAAAPPRAPSPTRPDSSATTGSAQTSRATTAASGSACALESPSAADRFQPRAVGEHQRAHHREQRLYAETPAKGNAPRAA